jgi:hypothetical protein
MKNDHSTSSTSLGPRRDTGIFPSLRLRALSPRPSSTALISWFLPDATSKKVRCLSQCPRLMTFMPASHWILIIRNKEHWFQMQPGRFKHRITCIHSRCQCEIHVDTSFVHDIRPVAGHSSARDHGSTEHPFLIHVSSWLPCSFASSNRSMPHAAHTIHKVCICYQCFKVGAQAPSPDASQRILRTPSGVLQSSHPLKLKYVFVLQDGQLPGDP